MSKAFCILSGLLAALLVIAAIPTCDCRFGSYGHHRHDANHGTVRGALGDVLAALDHDHAAGSNEEACTDQGPVAVMARIATIEDGSLLPSFAPALLRAGPVPDDAAPSDIGAPPIWRPSRMAPLTLVLLKVLLLN